MLPLILGAVALGTVGYGIAKVLDDDCDCSSIKTKSSYRANTTKDIEQFYSLKQTVYETLYSEFVSNIKKVKNLDLDNFKEINIKSNFPQNEQYIDKINNIVEELYLLLDNCNNLFKLHIAKTLSILEVSKDYKSYSKDAKKTLSDTLVLSNTINDILNINLINQNDKPTKSSKRLVKEVQKVLDSFKDEMDEKLVA